MCFYVFLLLAFSSPALLFMKLQKRNAPPQKPLRHEALQFHVLAIRGVFCYWLFIGVLRSFIGVLRMDTAIKFAWNPLRHKAFHP